LQTSGNALVKAMQKDRITAWQLRDGAAPRGC
jgi:hypothetical protein